MFPEKLRIVIDTGVLISRIVRPNSVPAEAIRVARSIGVMLVSNDTLAELADVLTRPKFDRYFQADYVQSIVNAYAANAELIEVAITIAACSDPKDDKFLALALSGSANVIVTGDSDLLALDPFQHVRILTPRAFIESFPHLPERGIE